MSAVSIPGTFGFGTLSLTWTPTPPPLAHSVDLLQYVTGELDAKLINGGDFYGPGNANLKLLKAFVDSNTDEVNRNLIISIKGGADGSKSSISRSIDNLISFFPLDKNKRPKLIFETARVDPFSPYDKTIGYIADYVKAGKIDGVSLSEVGVGSIQKAISVYPISFVELEFSLITQDMIHNGVLAELSKHQIPILAYSPVGRGLLTDSAATKGEDFVKGIPAGDIKMSTDRFQKNNFQENLKLIRKLYEFAHEVKNTSLESLALSWILKVSGSVDFQGINNVTRIIPIPGGSTKEKITRNLAQPIDLTDDDMNAIDEIVQAYPIKGARYNKGHTHMEFA